MHKLTAIKLSGCSLSHVALSGQRPDKQMASPRRSAFWASWVIASASSRITNLKPFLEENNTAVEGGVLLLMWVTKSWPNLLEYGPGAGKTQNWTTYDIDTSVV